MSSYGKTPKNQEEPKPLNRGASTSSSRQKLYQPKKTGGRDLGQHSSRYTPKSKDRREENVHSFVAHDSSSFLKQEGNRGNSVSGDTGQGLVDEEEEKRLIEDNPLRKRVFLNISKTSSSVQVSWSHANKTKTGKRVQYILEYGVGIKMNGEEQFRQIYKGKAHK